MPTASSTETRFVLSDDEAKRLAAEFGTPLYVVSEAHITDRIRRYRAAFAAAWPKTEITFASKANSTLAVLQIAHREGCLIDAASEGELRAALAAGVPADRCHLHGNNKSEQELRFALAAGINQIVVDNFDELELINTLFHSQPERPATAAVIASPPAKSEAAQEWETEGGGPREYPSVAPTCRFPDLVLRLAPGVDPVTHAKISTGQADTKFGFNIADGSAERALGEAIRMGLPVVGFHCHVGSQLLDPGAQISGGEVLAQFAADMLAKHGFRTEVINVGGGLGVHYVGDAKPMSVEDYCRDLVAPIVRVLKAAGLEPVLVQEPGRSLVGEAGVTVYRVGTVKTVPSQAKGERTYVVVDGGLSDNPRPALYGSRYTVLAIGKAGPDHTVTVSGKHCETDMLFEDVELPESLSAGDLVQVLVTGAYNSSMASNYNRYPRPATVLVRPDGTAVLVQRRDDWDEMFAREILPEASPS